jgi:hypothetical protein
MKAESAVYWGFDSLMKRKTRKSVDPRCAAFSAGRSGCRAGGDFLAQIHLTW